MRERDESVRERGREAERQRLEDEEVLRLDVPMEHARAMQRVQAQEDLADDSWRRFVFRAGKRWAWHLAASQNVMLTDNYNTLSGWPLSMERWCRNCGRFCNSTARKCRTFTADFPLGRKVPYRTLNLTYHY